jgi:drug/metabolite transporter (DMT)-like permease
LADKLGPLVRAAAYVATYAVISTCGVLLLRTTLKGVDVTGSSVRSVGGDPRFVGGVVLYGLSFLVWLLALRRYEVSQIFPAFIAASFAGVIVGSWLLLGESMTGMRGLGIAIVAVGLVLLMRP